MSESQEPREPTFEEALARLEVIVRDLEEGETPLAEAISQYEAGIGMLKRCYALLESAERRIELLTGQDVDGNPITQPFDAEASTEEPTAAARSRKRGARGKAEG